MQLNHQNGTANTAEEKPALWRATWGDVWHCLVEDSGAGVLVLSPGGDVLFANEAAVRACGRNGGTTFIRTLRDLFGENLAEERVGIAAEVCSTNQPVALEGVVCGKMLRMVFRCVRFSDMNAGVIATLSPVVGGSRDGVATRRAVHNDSSALSQLTARELDILRLIGMGLSTADIAEKLDRSVKTVEWHRVSLGEKLGAANRVELARIAIASGLVGAGAA